MKVRNGVLEKKARNESQKWKFEMNVSNERQKWKLAMIGRNESQKWNARNE